MKLQQVTRRALGGQMLYGAIVFAGRPVFQGSLGLLASHLSNVDHLPVLGERSPEQDQIAIVGGTR